jgi:hypothetical protein
MIGMRAPDVIVMTSVITYCPGGKAQLIEEATRYASDFTASGLAAALDGDDPLAAVHAFASGWIEILRGSEFADGCPVVAATLEGDRSPQARSAAAAAFERWEAVLTTAFARHVPSLARARATRSVEPLERVAAELEQLIEAAVRD